MPRLLQGDKSQESRQPREGQADPSVPQYLETQAGRDVNPAQRVVGERARIHEALARTEGENALKGTSPGGLGASGPQGLDGQNELESGARP